MNALEQAPQDAAAAASTELVQDDELVEVVEVRGTGDGELVAHAPAQGAPTTPGKIPASYVFLYSSRGRDFFSSHSCVCGMISASTNARTLARNATWTPCSTES